MKHLIIALAAAVAVTTAFARITVRQGFEDDMVGFVSSDSQEDASTNVTYAAESMAKPSDSLAPYPFSEFGNGFLSLDTGDATLWRTNTVEGDVYLDMVMQFNPCTAAPALGSEGTKIAVYLNSDSNLVVMAGTSASDRTPHNYVTTSKLDPGTWGRLTISATVVDDSLAFGIRLNGVALTDGTTSEFPCLTDDTTVNEVGFSGTGALDDFVARTTDPYLADVDAAASIAGENYASLADAIADADANATIVLKGNASLSSAVLKAVTIDVNGNTLSSTALQPNVSIVDGAVTHGTVAFTDVDAAIEDVRITGGSVTLLASISDAALTLNGKAAASTTIAGYVAKVGATGFDTVAAAAAAVAAGTVSGDVVLLQAPTATVAVGSSATIDLNSLTVTATGASAFSISGDAEVTIKNGTVNAGYLAAFTSGTLNVLSGTYTLSTAIAADENGTIAISGGSFNKVVAANQCAAGYAPTTIANGGKYTVVALADYCSLYSTYGYAYSPSAANGNAYWQAFTLSRASTATTLPSGSSEGDCYLFNIAGDNLAANYSGVSLKAISVVWGSNSDINTEIGKKGLEVQPDAYLVVTLEDNTIVAISAANDSKWVANGTSTFAFNGEHLDSATAFRAQFVTSVEGLVVGEKLTSASAARGRVNMRYHYSSTNSRADATTANSASNTYSANISIVVEKAVASVDGVYYPSLAGAISAATPAGKTVVLNCANDESVTIPSNVTLNLNGYSATGTISGGGRIVGASSSTPLVDFGSWTGTFVVNWDPNGSFKFNNYGVSGSTVEIGTWSGFQDIADIPSLTVNPAVKVTTSMTMNNGYTGSGNKTTFAAISGNGALNFTKKLASDDLYYAINKLDGSNVVLTVSNGSWNQETPNDKKHTYVTVGCVNLSAEPSIGVKVVQVALDEYCDLRNDADESAKAGAGFGVTIADVPSETMLVYDSDGLYVAVASVTANDATTYYKTIDAAAIAALNASTNEFTLLRTEAGTTLPNWIYDAETGKFIKDSSVASIGDTKYETLAEAIADAGTNDTITLLSSISDPISLNKTITLDAGGYVCTGALSGNGTLTLVRDAQMTFGEWSGTVVVDWDASGGRIKPDRYGIDGSTVKYARALTSGYFNINADTDGAPSVAPAVYFADNVTIDNGFSDENKRTTFAKVGMASGKTFKTRNGGSYYTFTVLEGFEGTIEVRGTAHVTVGTVVRAAAPVADECVVKVTKGASAVLDDLSSVKVKVGAAEAVTMPMQYATKSELSGLYLAEYTVCFFDDVQGEGSQIGEAQTVAYGAKATAPTAPEKTGYTFVDWTPDTNAVITAATDFYPTWSLDTFTLAVTNGVNMTVVVITNGVDTSAGAGNYTVNYDDSATVIFTADSGYNIGGAGAYTNEYASITEDIAVEAPVATANGSSGIDADETKEVVVDPTGKTEEQQKQAAIDAVTLDIKIPKAVEDEGIAGLDKATYQSYFKKVATAGATAGTWIVSAELDAAQVFTANAAQEAQSEQSILAAALDDGETPLPATIQAAKPGLYYSMEASNGLGFTAGDGTKEGTRTLATGTTVTIGKPATMPAGNAVFFRVKVSTKAAD